MNFIPAKVKPNPSEKDYTDSLRSWIPKKKIVGQKVWDPDGNHFVILGIDWDNAYIEVQNVHDLTKLKMTWEYFSEIWIKETLK